MISFQHFCACAMPVAFGAGVNVTLNRVSVDRAVTKVFDLRAVSGSVDAEVDAMSEDARSCKATPENEDDGCATDSLDAVLISPSTGVISFYIQLALNWNQLTTKTIDMASKENCNCDQYDETKECIV